MVSTEGIWDRSHKVTGRADRVTDCRTRELQQGCASKARNVGTLEVWFVSHDWIRDPGLETVQSTSDRRVNTPVAHDSSSVFIFCITRPGLLHSPALTP